MSKPDIIEALQSVIAEDFPGAIVTHAVMVIEFLDPEDNQRALAVRVTDGTTPWLARGMIGEAVEIADLPEPQGDEDE